MDVRTASKAPTRRLEKIIVVGISNDRDLRHRFEDKLVSYLRGRGGKAITSYPLVPDFKDIGDRQRILQVLDQEGVDGVMTVRAVAVDDMGEENWAAAWKSNLAKDSSVRDLIEQSLPLTEKTAKHYGVEFALWDRRTPGALWAARSGVHTRKQLRKGVTEPARQKLFDTPRRKPVRGASCDSFTSCRTGTWTKA
jgi:hypothetical protein